ncbi:IS110 family transposase [Mesorhizobium sp. CO1-1-7]|nr:IS110 family transposase [Mesorhizobium sp. CO1-1-7]
MVKQKETAMRDEVHVVGLDIAKSVFHVHGADQHGREIVRRKLRRDDVEQFFRVLPSCLVGLEACPGAHFSGRLLRSMGHEVRLIPAQYVRPYVKTNKNDAADAEAICEAVTRPTMRFVPIKEEMQQEILVIHRVRAMLIRQRTQLINAIRGHLAEFGVIGPNRAHNIGLLTVLIEDESEARIPAVARHALRYLVEQLREVKTKLARIDSNLVAVARGSSACRRLMTIPGVGVVTASALVSSMRDPADRKRRHFPRGSDWCPSSPPPIQPFQERLQVHRRQPHHAMVMAG